MKSSHQKMYIVRAHYSRLMKKSLKRGGGWEATFQFLVFYAYLVGTAPVLNADHRAQPDIKNPIMYKLSIILFVLYEINVQSLSHCFSLRVRTSNTPRTAIAKDCC